MKWQKEIQCCSCFLTLHTLAKKVKKYVPLDKKTGQPVSGEMRSLLFYAREIDKHAGRHFLRRMMAKVHVPFKRKK
jgi:hypothetical protein